MSIALFVCGGSSLDLKHMLSYRTYEGYKRNSGLNQKKQELFIPVYLSRSCISWIGDKETQKMRIEKKITEILFKTCNYRYYIY